ncbi:craniofacial development protein 2-like [Nilaparvata lugens]|uniref:craniofacial development protein 2-like n=1 Tax=Nilaparvata lugens TaxID=108931 RepID=UPI00193CA48E|nr:craniofacial development protein 2-like [Nilaparvata lugens]
MYADDTTLNVAGDNEEELEERTNLGLLQLDKFFKDHCLRLNPTKCEAIKFSAGIREDEETEFTVDGHVLQETSNSKFLGLTIDQRLSWKSHVDGILKKLNSGLYSLRETAPKESFSTVLYVFWGAEFESGGPVGFMGAAGGRVSGDLRVWKECEVVDELEKYKLKILGLSETKKKVRGEMAVDKGYSLLYSGVEMNSRAKEGVGIIFSGEYFKRIVSWNAVNSRIISANLDLEEKVSLIQIYAPTDDSAELERETFYLALQETVDKARQYAEHLIIMGDWNARVGNDITIGHGCLGKHGAESVLNGSGKRMLQFCIDNDLLVGNSFYKN